MRKVICAGLLVLLSVGLATTACTRSASQAAAPTPSLAVAPTPMPSPASTMWPAPTLWRAPTPTPDPTPTPAPTRAPTREAGAEPGAQAPAVDGPRVLVDRFAAAWVHGNAQEIVDLFIDDVEYQMGPNYITDKRMLWWFTEYWLAGGGKLPVTHCDPELGNTIRCDLEFTSDCTPALDLGALHFDARFTVRRGKIEKLIATMPEDEFRELSKVLEGMFAWAAANMATPWAAAVNSGDPRAAAAIEVKGCIEYGKSLRVTPAP